MDKNNGNHDAIEGEYVTTAQRDQEFQRLRQVMDQGPPENWGRLHVLLDGIEGKTVQNVGCIAGIENGQFVFKHPAVLDPTSVESGKLITQY